MARVSTGAASADVDAYAGTGGAQTLEAAVPTMPRVSVVIPAYNAADTLDETLESLAGQSEPHWEAVVVDDGSTDDTVGVVEAWSRRDPRVRLLRQPNGGVSSARNTGIEAAHGPWIFFLDADDWLHPRALEHFLAGIEGSGAGLAYGSLTRVAPDGTCDPLWCHPGLADDPAGSLRHQNHLAVHVMVSRTLVRELGGFDPALRTNEDWDLWRRMAFGGTRFVRVPEAITYYRMRAGSASMNGRQMLSDALQVLRRNPPLPAGSVRSHWEDDDFRRTLYALWCAALEAGAGREATSLFDGVDARLETVAHHTGDAAACMFDAARVGARITVDRSAHEWTRISGLLQPLVAHIVRETGQPDLGRRLSYALEQKALSHHDYAEPITLETVHAREIDLRRPLPDIVPPERAETLQLRIYAGAEPMGALSVPLYGPLPARELARFLVGFLYREPFMSRSRTLAKPRFWAEAAARAPLAVARALPSPRRAKRAAFEALTEAAVRAAGPDIPADRRTSMRRTAEIIAEETRRAGAMSLRDSEPARLEPIPVERRSEQVPVLMYHRVATEGPEALARYRLAPEAFEAQLVWLRDNGWRTITTRELTGRLHAWRGFPDKAVVLTFDDAFRDFREAAWPLLKRYGFGAEVYVPTDRVGTASDWDARYGPTAPLMDWSEIEALASEGVVFGSHLATHTRPDSMSGEDLLREAVRSRAALEARLGTEVREVATPHGAWDERIAQVLALAGYRTVYTTEPGVTRIGHRALRLKRTEVRGDLGLDAFVEGLTSG